MAWIVVCYAPNHDAIERLLLLTLLAVVINKYTND